VPEAGRFAATVQIGEGFAGGGADAAHVNTVLGRKGGLVEAAWTTALATPRAGYAPFVAVLRPNLPVKPITLFVNKADVRGERHATLTWGPAQAGVAGGVADAVAAAVIPAGEIDALLLIAAVWVDRTATRAALEAGVAGTPALDDVLAARAAPSNPFFEAPPPPGGFA
jgi:5,6,7,8-tetrahydromethanopterin hydro-lyase